MNTKYLFLDIDGTLVGFDGVMPSSASEALKKSSRKRSQARNLHRQTALAGLSVAFKGDSL